MAITDGPLNFTGQVEFVIPDAATVDSATILAALRDALIRRGVAVAETDGFQSYDLELVVPPMIRVPINALRRNDRSIAMLYRIRTTPRRALVAAAIIFAVLAATSSIGAGVVGVIFAALAVGVLAINRASRIPAIIKALRRRGSPRAWNFSRGCGRKNPMTSLELYGHAIRRMRPHLGRLAIAIAGVLLASATEVLKPWPLKIVIDNVLRGVPLVSSWIPRDAARRAARSPRASASSSCTRCSACST